MSEASINDDKSFVLEQIRERLRFYSSLTDLGFPRSASVEAPSPRPVAAAPARPAKPGNVETLEEIRADLGECTRCRLSEKRTTIVFGVGNPKAELMFVGEGPGHEEDRQGIPFVGAAGQLLTKIIQAIDLTREQVYIANVVKCRPPNNRDPEPDEVEACRPFLDRQIDAVRPKVICALGRVSALNLLRTDEGITRLRGRIFTYRGCKLVPTYHPAFLLRNPGKKRECWEDMKLVKKLLSEV
ncbi:MAG TPA: uracil-DNA glycosylase [Vicinamibacteria bacterium]